MADVGGYCIDTTEVTQAQYKTFMDARGLDVSGQPAYCSGNTAWAPSASCTGTVPFTPTTTPNRPVTCVEWCDAYAYCAWAGKRLCGRIGGGPNPMTTGYVVDESASQRTKACSQGFTTTYCYGSTHSTACMSGSGPADVATLPLCRGSVLPYHNVFDMSGNVKEWEDSCIDSYSTCRIRDSGFHDTSATTGACSGDISLAGRVGAAYDDTGFRCCAL
jgi:formylglycine-generating enzyme required for sulfatase activity